MNKMPVPAWLLRSFFRRNKIRRVRFRADHERLLLSSVILAAVMLIAAPLAQAITINGNFIGVGTIAGHPATPPSLGVQGGGNLMSVFDAAATAWEQAIGDSATININFGWADLDPPGMPGAGPLAIAQGLDIAFNSSFNSGGFFALYLDPVPMDHVEYRERWHEEVDLGAGTVNVARVRYLPNIPEASTWDILSVAAHEIGHVLGIQNLPMAPPGHYTIGPNVPFAGSQVPLANPSHFSITLPDSIPPGSFPNEPRSLMAPALHTGVRYLLSDIDILAVASVNGWTQVNLNPQGSPSTGIPYAKWSQLPENMRGENIPSDFDWREIMKAPPPNGPPPPIGRDPNGVPARIAADDFVSDGRPIEAVRWWGSYFGDIAYPEPEHFPTPEHGFAISFFADIPSDPAIPGSFSLPGQLLGTYILPKDQVEITGTDMLGWDGHNVVKYEARLEDAFLHHAIAGLSEPEAFYEVAGVIYWISIAAWDGVVLDPFGNPVDTGEPVRQITTLPDGTVIEEHIWGWHTSPDSWNDVGVVGTLDMYNPPTDWDYHSWRPVVPVHGLDNFAFELLTSVPEPSSILGALVGMMMIGGLRQRRSG